MLRTHMPRNFLYRTSVTSSEAVRDVVIGMSDGLTVQFALAARLSGTGQFSSPIVVTVLAEVVVGAIAMGL